MWSIKVEPFLLTFCIVLELKESSLRRNFECALSSIKMAGTMRGLVHVLHQELILIRIHRAAHVYFAYTCTEANC